MGKLYINTARELVAYSDKSQFEITARRRAWICHEFGTTQYVPDGWHIILRVLAYGQEKLQIIVPQKVTNKAELIEMLEATGVFNRALKEYKQLKTKK